MEIKETTENMMKSIIDVQENHREQINELKNTIDGIRATMMTFLRFELKNEMNRCILKGYRTPWETEEIEAKYHDYTEHLSGNHGITRIFEDDFMALPVKDKDLKRRKAWKLFMK